MKTKIYVGISILLIVLIILSCVPKDFNFTNVTAYCWTDAEKWDRPNRRIDSFNYDKYFNIPICFRLDISQSNSAKEAVNKEYIKGHCFYLEKEKISCYIILK